MQQLEELEKQVEELDDKLRSLYENFMARLVLERQYRTLLIQYDQEQTACEEKITELKKELAQTQEKPMQFDRFVKLIQKYKEPAELTEAMLHDLVDKIIVHEANGGRGNSRAQEIEIYFNFIGQFELAFSEEEIKAAQKEEVRQQREKKTRKKKGAKARYQKKKQERYDECEGHKFAKRICEHCGQEFWPNGNKQKYCCKECTNAAKAARVKAQRYAEKGDHTFRQKNCIVCGKPFWPVNGQEVMCSEECKRSHRIEKQNAYYHEVVAEKEKAKRDAKREQVMAENDGHIWPKRSCEYCGEEFWPTKSHQKYCCNDCSRKGYEMTDKGRDPHEKEGHKFYKRLCVICGQEFWPGGPNTACCSPVCSKIFYRKNAKEKYEARKAAAVTEPAAV